MKYTSTKYHDRWDVLAYDLLGDSSLAPILMDANPNLVSEYIHIPIGSEVVIPDVYVNYHKISQIKAPWKD